MFVSPDPCSCRVFFFLACNLDLIHPHESLDRDALNTFRICAMVEDFIVRIHVSDIVHVFGNHWVHFETEMSLQVSLGLNLVTSYHIAGCLVQVSRIHSVGVLGISGHHDGLAEVLRALVGLLAQDSLRSVRARVLRHLHLD